MSLPSRAMTEMFNHPHEAVTRELPTEKVGGTIRQHKTQFQNVTAHRGQYHNVKNAEAEHAPSDLGPLPLGSVAQRTKPKSTKISVSLRHEKWRQIS